MLTAHDKAIVALIMAAIQLTNSFGWTHFGLDEHTITEFVAFATTAMVWLVPNKNAAIDQQKGSG